MSKLKLYPCFKKWEEFDSITIFSDPHFDDEDVKVYRGNISSEEIVKNINKTCGKKSVFICLGDVGNVEWVKKIRGYKVLIKGNHDSGSTNYQREIKPREEWVKSVYNSPTIQNNIYLSSDDDKVRMSNELCNLLTLLNIEEKDKVEDNHLFDEVYEGPLFINEKILLSHEPIDVKGVLNIHGHIHDKNHKDDYNHLNVCAEHISYTPVRLNDIVKQGYLSKIDSIHRETIDRATDRKRKRENKNV